MKIDTIVITLLFVVATGGTFAFSGNLMISGFVGAMVSGFQLAMNWVIADISESFSSW